MWLAEQNSPLPDTAQHFEAISAFLQWFATTVMDITTDPEPSAAQELSTGNWLLPAPWQKGFLGALCRG